MKVMGICCPIRLMVSKTLQALDCSPRMLEPRRSRSSSCYSAQTDMQMHLCKSCRSSRLVVSPCFGKHWILVFWADIVAVQHAELQEHIYTVSSKMMFMVVWLLTKYSMNIMTQLNIFFSNLYLYWRSRGARFIVTNTLVIYCHS